MREKRIFALGFFDGVHLGHQALLRACRELAEQNSALAVAMTFDAHPLSLLQAQTPALLSSTEDRVALLKDYGMDEVKILSGGKETLSTPWETFLTYLTEKCGAVGFVCGDDFRFGAGGEGNGEKLKAFCKERNLPCVIVGEQTLGGVRISSSYIRALFGEGEMEKAVRFLGHPHRLSGIVVYGKQIGRTIGIPTANLQIPEGVICPAFGVYACRVSVDGESRLAVVNVGTHPTVAGGGITVESHLLDFSGDLYGKTLTVHFEKFLRPEKKFETLRDLQAEIQKNARQTRKIFQKSEK